MIRLLMQADGRRAPTVVLGLEPENLRRLAAGQPITVNLRELDPDAAPREDLPDVDIVIAATDTDDWRRFRERLEPAAPLYSVSTPARSHAHRADSATALCGRYSTAPARIAGRIVAPAFDPDSALACRTCAQRSREASA